MLFNTTSRISSNLSPEQVRSALLGKHLQVKGLDFEIKDSESTIKIIPHTEYEDKARLPPITHVEIANNGNGSRLTVSSKPRRLDLGGLYLVSGFIIVLILIGIFLRVAFPEQSYFGTFAVLGLSLLVFIIFRLRLQASYYSYIHDIRAFIKKNVA